MIEINLVQIFRPWKTQEIERTIATHLDEAQAEIFMQRVQKYFPKHQLEPSNCYFFEVQKVDVRPIIALQEKKRSDNLWRIQVLIGVLGAVTACTLSITAHRYFKNKPKIALFVAASFSLFAAYRWSLSISEFFYLDQIPRDRESVPFDVILARAKGGRKPPETFDISRDVDPQTLEKISAETLDSPHMIFLPSYITDAKGCVQLILAEGESEFCDPIDRRSYTEQEREVIIQQITRIFGVSKDIFFSCFELVVLPVVDPDYRGVDKYGNYTQRATEALDYAINELHDSSLKEIDTFFNFLEKKIGAFIETLREDPAFRDKFYWYVRLDQIACSQELLNQQFPDLFSYLGPSLIFMSISLGSGKFIRPVLLLSFFKLSAYQAFGPDSLRENVDKALKKLKKQYIREIRLEILQMTPFYKDLKKEEEGKARVARFEELTGIFLQGS